MKKSKKSIIIGILILTLTLTLSLLPGTVLAESSDVGIMSVNTGTSTIKMSGKTVTYSATTSSIIIEDQIIATATLQVQKNGVWTDVPSSSVTKTNTKSSSATVSSSKTVDGGYYYRTKGTHKTVKGTTTDTKYSYSNSVWVP